MGVVNWDSIASYILLMLYENEDKQIQQLVPVWKDIRNIHKFVMFKISI
jgi:hypothetical protein